jgi:AbrB family looped-hinge helix DNA binding protein
VVGARFPALKRRAIQIPPFQGEPPPGHRREIEILSTLLDLVSVRRYLTDMKTAVSTKGQIVLPAEIRQQDGIEPGQVFEIERIDRGEYRLVLLAPPRNQGLLDWLLACPEKGYFVPIESESTDTL